MSEARPDGRSVVRTVTTDNSAYGPLQPQFHFDVTAGYTALFGANNSGKSSLLQLIFRTWMGQAGPESVCLILPDRHFLAGSNETGGNQLSGYNQGLLQQLASQPLPHEAPVADRPALGRLLVHHRDMYTQFGELRKLLLELGLPEVQIGDQGTLRFEQVQGYFQGSGLRCLYPIVAALTDPRLELILIDEPEASLEPARQKALRDLLVSRAVDGKAIVVASHSHLFVNREDIPANHVVRRLDNGNVDVEQLFSEGQLLDLVFKLLGNSTEDLFFPGNYVVVEGGSDQTLVARALELLGANPGQVKVVSATGVMNVQSVVHAVEQALLPLVFADSPYRSRVVALVDQPNGEAQERGVEELRAYLGDRLVVLPEPSLEEHVPAALYEAAGLDRGQELERVRRATSSERKKIKGEIARAVSDRLTVEQLDSLPEIKRVAEQALEPL